MDRSDRRHAYFWTQLDSVDRRLQELFDELGVSGEQRVNREQEFFKLISKAVQNHVTLVEQERDTLRQQCVEMQQQAQKMMSAVPDIDWAPVLGDLDVHVREEVGPPYTLMYETLKDVMGQLDSVFGERKAVVTALAEQIRELAVKMEEPQLLQQIERQCMGDHDKLNLSQASIDELGHNLQHLQGEYQKRVARMAHCATAIVTLWTELGTPQNEIDRSIVQGRSDVKLLGAKKSDLHKLAGLMQALEKEKEERGEQLAKVRQEVSTLWTKLSEDEEYVQRFVQDHLGLTQTALNAYSQEFARLQEKKREHIQLFIEDARKTLNEMWNKLFMSDEEVQQFTPAFTNIYTDASLDAHESEISRLNAVYEERKPLLTLVEAYYGICRDEFELAEASRDASRLMSKGPGGGGRRDPGRLLKEEQMRNRVQRRKPKILSDLRQGLVKFQAAEGRAFMVPSSSLSNPCEPSDHRHNQDVNLLEVVEAELNKVNMMQGRRAGARPGSSMGRVPSAGSGSNVSTPLAGTGNGQDYMRSMSQSSVRSAGASTPSLRRPPSEMRSHTTSRMSSYSPTKKHSPTAMNGSPTSSSSMGMRRSERSFEGKLQSQLNANTSSNTGRDRTNSNVSIGSLGSSLSGGHSRQSSIKRAGSSLSYSQRSSNNLQAQIQSYGSRSGATTGSTSTSASENWETFGDEGSSDEEQNALGQSGRWTQSNSNSPGSYQHPHTIFGQQSMSGAGGLSRITDSVASIRMDEEEY